MSPTGPATPAPDAFGPRRHAPSRTLCGAFATVSLFVAALFAALTPPALLVGPLVALGIGAAVGFGVGQRRNGAPASSRRRVLG